MSPHHDASAFLTEQTSFENQADPAPRGEDGNNQTSSATVQPSNSQSQRPATPNDAGFGGLEDITLFSESGSKTDFRNEGKQNRSNIKRISSELFDDIKETGRPCILFENHLRMLIRHNKFDGSVVDNEGYNLLMAGIMAKSLSALRIIFCLGLWTVMRSFKVVSTAKRHDVEGKDALQLAQSVARSKKVLMEIKKFDALEESLGPLHKAARAGDEKKVEDILKNTNDLQVNIRKRDDQGNGALHYACMSGNTKVVDALVKAGANIKAVNNQEQNLLHIATQHGNYRLVKYLLMRRVIPLTDKDDNGKTPMMYTAENGDVRLMTLLRHHGADLENGILGTAAQRGCLFYLRHAIDKLKMHLTEVDSNEKTILHYACNQSRFQIVKYIQEKLNKTEMSAMLLKRDKSGRNALHFCCESEAGQASSTLKLLIDMAKACDILKEMLMAQDFFTGCSSCVLVSGKDKGRAAFHYVETKRHLASIFEKGVNTGMVDVAKFGTVLKSGWGEHPSRDIASEVEKSLLARINSSAKAQLDWTPLHAAVYKQKEDLVDILVDSGADVNTQDFVGLTPYHLAAMRGNMKMVKKLESAGANSSIKDLQGLTAGDVAKENEHPNVEHFIKGKDQFSVALNFVREVQEKVTLLKMEELERLRTEGKDLRQHLIDALRAMQIDVNITLMAIGSSPIMEETMD